VTTHIRSAPVLPAMGYACPVCEDPQADAEHLANHLAFTAMLGDADHEEWLDDHAPDWEQADADRLASVVTDHAEDVDFPQVFEDTTGTHRHDHERDRSGALFDDEPDFAADARERAPGDRRLDERTEQVLEEAREMTRRMRDDAEADDGRSDEAETE